MASSDGKIRCWGDKEDFMRQYHDEEWGVPLHDDNEHYGLLVLEGAQAGLSWRTVLLRRDSYRKAFSDFDPVKVAEYTEEKMEDIRLNSGIIRNKLKVKSAVKNAKAFLKIQEEFGSFDKYIWGWVDNKPKMNEYKSWSEVPAETELSKAISKDLKKRGFSFVGPTIMYAYMQSIGMVNDHQTHCFRWREIKDKYGE
ncbi:MAG: DNA-3-methyladenine glycosylase I [Candidatus Bathyarchaeota archaeon]|nr:DNA-3-methyladenine glycosylase I [Candidatus Bathyarchaeota archaeon]